MNTFLKESLKVEEVETNKSLLTFTVGPERFKEGLDYAYNKTRSRFDIAGFRKGKAPKKIIEMQYGAEVFFPEAVDFVLDSAYEAAAEESGLDVVSQPEIDVLSVSREEGVVFTALVYTKPVASVDNYKGLTYTRPDSEPTDEEIDKIIEEARDKNSRMISVSDRTAQLGDTVTIDYEGFVDGVAFDGGTAEGFDLVLGSHTFIDGFEEQLVGAELGGELEINVRFPDEYHAEDLSGKDAMFSVAVKEIRSKELPELNDDFAQDVSEFDTFDEYRQSIASGLAEEKEKTAERNKSSQVIEKLAAETSVDLPEPMIETELDQVVSAIKSRIESNGMPFNMYLQYFGQTPEQFREASRETAIEQLKARLALAAIAEKEQLEVTGEELEAELARMSEAYNIEPDRLKEIFGKKELANVKNDLLIQKAVELVLDAAVVEAE